MPIHDWTRVPAGLFHHFHQDWSIEITRTLNRGLLPKGLSALVEQRAGVKEGDILTIERRRPDLTNGGGALTMTPPTTQFVRRTENELYSARANQIVIRHHLGEIIAVIEIVSPGNKDSKAAVRSFVEKMIDFLRLGVHLLVIDLFPPTKRDPFGMHKVIWDEIVEEDFKPPEGKDRILVAYENAAVRTAYIETIGVGDVLPSMPLFLDVGAYVRVPLEATYQAAWDASPEDYRNAVETGVVPDADVE